LKVSAIPCSTTGRLTHFSDEVEAVTLCLAFAFKCVSCAPSEVLPMPPKCRSLLREFQILLDPSAIHLGVAADVGVGGALVGARAALAVAVGGGVGLTCHSEGLGVRQLGAEPEVVAVLAARTRVVVVIRFIHIKWVRHKEQRLCGLWYTPDFFVQLW
jgi:hypothetical protein